MVTANLILLVSLLLAHGSRKNGKKKLAADFLRWSACFNWRDDKTTALEVLISGR